MKAIPKGGPADQVNYLVELWRWSKGGWEGIWPGRRGLIRGNSAVSRYGPPPPPPHGSLSGPVSRMFSGLHGAPQSATYGHQFAGRDPQRVAVDDRAGESARHGAGTVKPQA